MTIDDLCIEVTRQCTLMCEHCLRGENRNEYMKLNTIKAIFKDIKKINRLLITGGEPLLAISEIEEIIKNIKEKNIEVDKIDIITNGTVLNNRIINILNELNNMSNLRILLSKDIFHYLELVRLQLLEERNNNLKILDEIFGISKYSDDEVKTPINAKHKKNIYKIGRAKNISERRLEEINNLVAIKYIIKDYNQPNDIYYATNDFIKGIMHIDVNGNVVITESSFDEEDKEAENISCNVNKIGLKQAIANRIKDIEIHKNSYILSSKKSLSLTKKKLD